MASYGMKFVGPLVGYTVFSYFDGKKSIVGGKPLWAEQYIKNLKEIRSLNGMTVVIYVDVQETGHIDDEDKAFFSMLEKYSFQTVQHLFSMSHKDIYLGAPEGLPRRERMIIGLREYKAMLKKYYLMAGLSKPKKRKKPIKGKQARRFNNQVLRDVGKGISALG